jgi:type VI secretion system protein ImpH
MAAASRGNAVAVKSGLATSTQPSALPGDDEPRESPAPHAPRSVEDRLYAQGHAYDFFQAVALLERLAPRRKPVGRDGPAAMEIARFRSLMSLSFPASAVYDITRPAERDRPPEMTVAFLGLFGPSGILPAHYTDLLMRLEREAKGQARRALRDWLDLFNHRLIALFQRAWEKYRFYMPFARGEYNRPETFPSPGQDVFTRALFSCVGMGTPALRSRLRVSVPESIDGAEKPLVGIDDLGLLHFAGLLAQRPRSALGLQALLNDYFQLPVHVVQFQGQWLRLDAGQQTRMGRADGNNVLGLNAVAGERVWDVQGKIRIRVGPISYNQFVSLLPDRTPIAKRKGFFLLSHLTRLYIGAELDFEVQLLPRAFDMPPCQLAEGIGLGPRLGWNTWLLSEPMRRNPEDAVFEGQEVRWLA